MPKSRDILISKKDRAITPIFGHAIVRVLSNSMSTYCDEANRSFFKGDIAIIKSESSYRVGDVIAFPKVAGTKITFGGKKYIRVYASDVVAKEVEGEILEKEGNN